MATLEFYIPFSFNTFLELNEWLQKEEDPKEFLPIANKTYTDGRESFTQMIPPVAIPSKIIKEPMQFFPGSSVIIKISLIYPD